MSTNGLYSIATSALSTYQSAINVAGNNIANVYTPGYNRQVAQFSERPGVMFGNGVDILSIESIYDGFINNELRNCTSQYNQYSTYYDYSYNFDSFLGSEASNINMSLQDFFNSLQNALSDPESISYRTTFLNQANQLVSKFQRVDEQISSLNDHVNQQITGVVKDINGITQQIAHINQQIQMSNLNNDLLKDQRENLMKNLAEYVSFTAVDDGTNMNIYVGHGEALVVAGTYANLTTQLREDNNNYDIAIAGSQHNSVITNTISGGQLSGIIEFRDNILNQAKFEINRLAMVVGDEVNAVHQQGITFNGEKGGLFFSDINDANLISSRITPKSNNAGSASLATYVSDVTKIKPSEYQLTLTSPSTYLVTRLSDNSTVSSGAISTFPQTITFDGIDLEIQSGTFSANDQFYIDPFSSYIREFKIEITNAADVAFSSMVKAEQSSSNFGTGKIDFINIVDLESSSFSTPGALNPPLRIEFISENSFQVINDKNNAVISGPLSFIPGSDNIIFPTATSFDPGYRVTISGVPAAGDTFSINYNNNAQGDNTNGVLLADIKSLKLVDGNSTLQDGYAQFVSGVATKTHFSDIVSQSSKIALDQAQSSRDSVSGVNLDEEAANMLAYQQAYQMSAQLISIAESLFNTILELL